MSNSPVQGSSHENSAAAAQDALRQSEARFRAAVEAVDGILWTNDPQGRMVGEQFGWSRLTGQARAEYEGFGWAQAVHPDDAQPTIDAWLRAVESRSTFVFEHRVRRADGQWRQFSIRAVPVLDEDRQIREWVGIHTDVTELRANERLLKEDRDRAWGYFDQAPSFMAVVLGPDHVFQFANEAYKQIVGHRPLIGRTLREAFPEVGDQGTEGVSFFDLYDSIFRTGEPYVGRGLRVELQRVANGPLEERYVDTMMQPTRDANGLVSGIFINGVDVTHRKRAEAQLHRLNDELEVRVADRTQALSAALNRLQEEVAHREATEKALRQAQRLESLGKLTGGVAHDFNNLLQVISGNLQLLSREVYGNPRAETRIQNALGGVTRGAKLALQLLAFGRRQPLEPRVVNVGKMIASIDDMLRRALGDDIEIQTIVAGGLWNTSVDPGQVENVILNLAINARDAMPDGGRLTIECGNASLDDDYARRHDDVLPGQYVMVAVTDTGTGIPREILDRVFDPFFTTKAEGKGSGLGLSMVHGFIKQSRGHVKIYSEIGEGTTLKLYLPRSMEDEDAVAQVDTGPVRGGSETILVAEDDDSVRETAVALLSELGYRVLKARDAQGALTVIDSGIPIDLLFTDVVMPGPLRSPDLARKAVERQPNIAVLFTSGYTENAIVHHGKLDAGVDLLSKPYTREALARKVRHVLANRAQQRLAEGALAGGRSTASPSNRAELASPGRSDVRAMLKVLVVEDDELIRTSTAEMARELGYDVRDAPDGKRALALLEAGSADILLTDVSLPGMSGLDLATRALETKPSLQVVFATGDERSTSAAGWMHARVLAKPYQLEDLDKVLSEASRCLKDGVPQSA